MSSRAHVVAVVGARPNFVKMSALYRALAARPRFQATLVHTRQHHDENLSDVFFRQLDLPHPDVALEIPRGSHAAATADVMREFDAVLDRLPAADLVLVVGDVNSTLAASLVAVKRGIRVAHVEAGLRSFNWAMPEEINRVITDRISDYLFTPSADADENLRREGIPADRIFLVGNVMIDTLLAHAERARACAAPESLGLARGAYAVATLHRQENVDDPAVLEGLVAALEETGRRLPLAFPVHPRTRQRLAARHALASPSRGVRLLEPIGYLEFLDLLSGARLVLTDSGGLQEETTILGVPCLTLRGETERPVTVTHGTNRVVGVRPDAILAAVDETLAAPPAKRPPPPLWEGGAAGRVVEVLERVLP
jgi:UDP-N-acetylglucosamine 2-epimerase (non-hydrolysing)